MQNPHTSIEASAKPDGTSEASHMDVVLVSMPFGLLRKPSIGLSLLKGVLKPLHVSAKILYFSLRFARLVGVPFYNRLAGGEPDVTDLLGEWIFSAQLAPHVEYDVQAYLDEVLHRRNEAYTYLYTNGRQVEANFFEEVLAVRDQVVGMFLDQCIDELISYSPRIIGFTSVFQQQIASLALARRVKARAPETFIVFGGANCEGVMGSEVVRQFPFVDAVVSGEGELVFPELVQRVLEDRSLVGLQGVYTRANVNLLAVNDQAPNAPSVHKMDELPLPEYDDFFAQWHMAALETTETPQLLFETSRGCWWGEKHHCTFCGLNGSTMTFRSKSAGRAMSELVTLAERYPNSSVAVVDNILDMKYFRDFIPELAKRGLGLELFYEVKANLRKEQVRQLHDAGILDIQPGIESLSTRVLELMNKGVKGLQNIQLLKWCEELGIKAHWNIIWGFPAEPPEEYSRMAQIIPLLTHLRPPISGGAIRLDRFSPNFDRADQFGFVDIAPYPAYRHVYSSTVPDVTNLAYFFTYKHSPPQDLASYVRPVIEQLIEWHRVYEQSDLRSVDKQSHLFIRDTRPVAQRPLTVLSGLQRLLYLACDRIHTIYQLQQLAEESMARKVAVGELEDCLHPLVQLGLMINEGENYLSLAIPHAIASAKESRKGEHDGN